MDRNKYLRPKNMLLDTLFPKQCVCCDEIIDSDEELCDNCIRNIERIDPVKRCKKCGLEKKTCQCYKYVYHFEECIAPFFNEGIARRGMYAFKFKRKAHYAVYFADEMAKSIKSEWGKVGFDAVCYVPSTAYSFLRRGFNQSYLLAERISKLLEIPLVKDSLYGKFNFKFQHNLKRDKRFEAVRNKYFYNLERSSEIRGKTVLLVDDIKTTGATLDECARQLLFAGANTVYAVCALITDTRMQPKTKRRINSQKILQKFGENIG
ncbi:MAG: ComF family protein [Ruminococcaceae bacterium]|nr:ComF family protein [Oscillospiraceae bacterium]